MVVQVMLPGQVTISAQPDVQVHARLLDGEVVGVWTGLVAPLQACVDGKMLSPGLVGHRF